MTNDHSIFYFGYTCIIKNSKEDVLKFGLGGEDLKGVVVDPFEKPFTMSKELLEKFISEYEE